MHAGGARLLRQAGDQLFDLLAHDHHHVGELVDHDDDVGNRLEVRDLGQIAGDRIGLTLEQRVLDRFTGLGGVLHLLVETGDVAYAQRRHQAVTPLHLGDAPAQRIGCLLHVGDDRGQQVRDTLVDRKLQHLGVDHDQADVFRSGLVHQAQDHRVDGHRLARAGRPRDQRMWHLGEIRDDRLANDVLAQRQGQRRLRAIVWLGTQGLAEMNHLAVFVGDLQADHGLARDDLDHAHRHHRQCPRQVLRQVGHLARLGAGRQLQLEQRHHGPGVHRRDLGRDTEIGELALDLAGKGLQRLGRQTLAALLRRIEQAERWQLGVGLGVEQGHLPFFFDPHTGADFRLFLLDKRWRLVALALLLLLHHLLAFLFHSAGLPFLGQASHQGNALAPGVEQEAANAVHHRQPGHTGKQRDTDQQQGQQQQNRTGLVQHRGARAADQVAGDTTGTFRQRVQPAHPQRCQRGGTEYGEHETDPARDAQVDTVLLVVAFAEHQPSAPRDHQRKHVRDLTEQHEQHAGRPGTRHPTGVVGMLLGALEHPARIVRRIGKQRHQEIGADRQQQQEPTFLESLAQRCMHLEITK